MTFRELCTFLGSEDTTLLNFDDLGMKPIHPLCESDINQDYFDCDMRKINKIIVHCSGTPLNITPKEIRAYHVNVLGWHDVGYHFLISADGEIHYGRPLSQVGAHCKGHNSDSIGICLIGGKDEFDFTWKQLRTLSSLVFDLVVTNHLSYQDVYSHHDFNPGKACPRFNARLVLQNIHNYGTF